MTNRAKTKLPHKHIIIGTLIGVIVLLAIWAISYFAIFGNAPGSNGPVLVHPENSTPTSSVTTQVQTVATGLQVPWSIVFTSPQRMLVTERDGDVRVVVDGQLKSEPLTRLTDVSTGGEEGLMGMTLDPEYTQNKLVYVCLAYDTPSGLRDKVVRFVDNGSSAGTPELVIGGIPSAQFHAGCKLKFGVDNKLYISTGDATNKQIAQDLNNLGGKILRLNPDGTVPSDNPFPDSPVWSYGHRNPQGLCFQPGTNQLYSVEHGPSGFDGPGGGDEVNIINKGANYGWPLASHESKKDGTIAPLLVFTPAVAPSACAFYHGNSIPQFDGNLFFAALKGEGLWRIQFSKANPSVITQFEKLEDINYGRLREVTEGPDGALYFTTSNRDGRGKPASDDDRILKIVPQE